jgi:dTDP-glucose 4,6-dehydratase
MVKKVLLTGHGGFVGHHCLQYFLEHTDWEFYCIDSFRHKGTCRRVVEAGGDCERVKTFKHDLTVPIDKQLYRLMQQKWVDPFTGFKHYAGPDIIINMASDSDVEGSVKNPANCIRNNTELMINMLEYAREAFSNHVNKLFIHISTDEVFGEAPSEGGHKEWGTVMPSNPYSASKAAQEAMAIAYWRTYNMPIAIVNIMNVIGERQNPEKFLPKIIQKVHCGEQMPIYADFPEGPNGKPRIGSRVYIHARDVASALVHIAETKPKCYKDFSADTPHEEVRPDRYNICGNSCADREINNFEFAQLVADFVGKPLNYALIPSNSARPGYDRRYMLDGSKLRDHGWEPEMTLYESVERIVKWTLENPHWMV